MDNKNIKLLVAYDGTHFLGWQKTKEGLSIEEELQKAIEQILQHPIQLQATSRTDAGVHCNGQPVNFFTTKLIDFSRLLIGLNSLLPPDIVVKKIEEMPLSFHPTTDSKSKEYCYFICTDKYQLPFHRLYSWHYPKKLNIDLMREAITYFLGEHDFSTFCNYRKNLQYADTIRRIDQLEIIEMENRRLQFRIIGNHFLYKMVRNIVGTIVYIGSGKIQIAELSQILESKDRRVCGVTAPAHGLFLHSVSF